jgi:hypothetical protein
MERTMRLSVVRNGEKLPYSFRQLRKDYPNVSFPRDLSGVDLTQYGVVVDKGEPQFMESPTVRRDFIEFRDSVNQKVATIDAKADGLASEIDRVKEATGANDVVPMYKFLYGIRQFGLRVQFERYVNLTQGHTRDFWFTSAFISRRAEYLQDVAKDFGLSELDLDYIFAEANKIGM